MKLRFVNIISPMANPNQINTNDYKNKYYVAQRLRSLISQLNRQFFLIFVCCCSGITTSLRYGSMKFTVSSSLFAHNRLNRILVACVPCVFVQRDNDRSIKLLTTISNELTSNYYRNRCFQSLNRPASMGSESMNFIDV